MIKKGIVLYNIELDNCLNGVWTNEINDGKIRNEIAKKLKEADNIIEGAYTSVFIDIDNELYTCRLEISLNGTRGTYTFKWDNIQHKCNSTSAKYEGIGYMVNEKQIAVHYWQTNL